MKKQEKSGSLLVLFWFCFFTRGMAISGYPHWLEIREPFQQAYENHGKRSPDSAYIWELEV